MPDTRKPDRPDRRRSRGDESRRDRCDSASGPRAGAPRAAAAPAWFGASLDSPSRLLRLRVFARRRTLDVELANGADPATSAALALRARQLVARTTRDSFAFGLEALVTEAARPPLPLGLAVPLPRREIMEARPTLRGLAACLRAERPVYARGMALLSRLLTDAAGPAFSSDARSDLHHLLAAAADALDGAPPGAA